MAYLQPPQPMASGMTSPATTWKKWRQRFETFLTAAGRQAARDEEKIALLLHAVGEEGVDVFSTFTFTAEDKTEDGQRKYAVVLAKFDEYYAPKTNVTYERHRFFTRSRQPGETVDKFVTDLRILAQTCEFDALTDSLIKDRVVCGIGDSMLTERLLRVDDLDLPKAIRICRAAEVSQEQLRRLDESAAVQSVEAVRVSRDKPRDKPRQQPSARCSRCGRSHGPYTQCPAKGKICHKCKGYDHFSVVCRTKSGHIQSVDATVDTVGKGETHPQASQQVSSITTETEVAPSLFIAALDHDSNSWKVPISTNGSVVTFKLDTGAQVNVLPRKIYRQLHKKPTIKPANARIMAYGSDMPLPLDGQCVCQVRVREGMTKTIRFYITSVQAEPILGLSACLDLELIKPLCSISSEAPPTSPTREDHSGETSVPIAVAYSDLFHGIGRLHQYPHTIRLQANTIPRAVASPRRVAYPLMSKVKEELGRMLTAGIIEEVVQPTPWVSPMVPVLKKDGKVRICVDYTELNKSVDRERFQLPVADDVFAKMSGAQYFTTLDAASGFWQIPLSPASCELTTFITPFGRYQFRRLPFGITSGPEVFHRSMKHMLADIEGTDCFIDDVIVWGATEKEHDERLRRVLDRCKQNGLRLNPLKCRFRQSQVKYFGHVVDRDGVHADGEKIHAVTSMPKPKDREELRRYMGMIAYLAKFLPHHSQVSGPLRELLRKETAWVWTPAHDEAYDRLQALITKSPVLAYYSPEAPITVSADASSYGIGAVLLQTQANGRKAPICYASRALTPTEQRYSQIEKEALAMVWACEKFECYLLGQPQLFVIETDHQPLQTVMNVQDIDQCPPRLQRLKMRMMRFLCHVTYVPGKLLAVADTLSRSPVGKADDTLEEMVEEYVWSIASVWPVSDFMRERIRQETSKDPLLVKLQDILRTRWPTTIHQLSPELRPLWSARHLFSAVEGIVLRGSQIVIPKSLRQDIAQRAHEGHLGVCKTKHRAREVVWWPGMNTQLETMVANCEICAKYRNQQRKEPLCSSPLPERPWQSVSADLFQWREAHYLLVVDHYSRFPEVHKLASLQCQSTIKALKQMFACHGIPNRLHSDNGPQFASREFRQFAHKYGFQHTTSSPLHPQGNGLVERAVHTVKDLLAKSRDSGEDFYLALLAYRATPHDTTSLAPAHLLMGRRLRTTLPSWPSVLQPELVPRPTIEACDEKRKRQQAGYYDRRHGAKALLPLKQGDPVLVWDMSSQKWLIPAIVQSKVHDRSYQVKTNTGVVLRRNRHQLRKRANGDPRRNPQMRMMRMTERKTTYLQQTHIRKSSQCR